MVSKEQASDRRSLVRIVDRLVDERLDNIGRGIAAVDAGRCHVIDVHILPDYQGLLG